jgi:hypothetical protein
MPGQRTLQSAYSVEWDIADCRSSHVFGCPSFQHAKQGFNGAVLHPFYTSSSKEEEQQRCGYYRWQSEKTGELLRPLIAYPDDFH